MKNLGIKMESKNGYDVILEKWVDPIGQPFTDAEKEDEINTLKKSTSMGLDKIDNQEKFVGLEKMIEMLPEPLKQTVVVLKSKEERIMGLYAAVTIAGALMAKVEINYAGRINYPGLFLTMIFPPASGKGNISLIAKVLYKINGELKEKNNKAIREYEMKLSIYKKGLKTGSPVSMPEKPSLPLLKIPGNITSSKLVEQLSENAGEEMLLIYENEMDALGIMANGGDYGSMNSTILRNAYHNEQISQMRKMNSEHLVVNNPKLAIVIIGTPSQVTKVLPSNADGLLSRMMVIKGDAPVKWMDVEPDNTSIPLDRHYEQLSTEYYDIWKHLSMKRVEVIFTSAQWEQINEYGKSRLFECVEFISDNAASIAKRHANIMVRIAAVLTMIRYSTEKRSEDLVECNENDFQIAKWMAEQSYECSIELFKELPGESIKFGRVNIKVNFYEELPDKFLLGDILTLAGKFKICERTLFRYLKEFILNGMLMNPKKGEYEKTSVSGLSVAETKLNNEKLKKNE